MTGRVQDKIALVTGGASGIGRAIVQALVGEGARVLIADINADAGRALADQLNEERGAAASFIQHDASSEAGWNEVAVAVRERYGRLDVLVNNAGILLKGSIEETSLDDWHKLLRVNSDSAFLGCRVGVALMKDSGGGSIINVSSIAALAGKDDYAGYCASKGAVAALNRAVAAHCRKQKYRIRCNSIHPDGVLTPMTVASYPPGIDPARFTIDSDPMNRMCLPEDVAAAALYLASDESRAINGIELRVDSGQFVMSI
ncbi:3(or 17)beta-hydroxysteroid dehydrogenase [Pseudomonas linyingensis]|uniref:3(Or 17)beta-hydroxysteroid dehydrogenase n=1 Tax=Pseudomonas linyingensis TaxID=915471 RepID=A0A1H6ZG86_9PSED|nr:SDR family oxidoreductase [Pseudomonas linyingensis]SEJ51716.1 3(or 17)beta-hydroxysteroid dehydrogenase [Pseudomonas linyingensis]